MLGRWLQENNTTSHHIDILEIYKEMGNLEKALAFFEKDLQLQKALYESYPTNVDFKNGLAISYHKLGDFYKKQNNEGKAKIYFLECQKLLKELAVQFPAFKEFGDNLAEVDGDLEKL